MIWWFDMLSIWSSESIEISEIVIECWLNQRAFTKSMDSQHTESCSCIRTHIRRISLNAPDGYVMFKPQPDILLLGNGHWVCLREKSSHHNQCSWENRDVYEWSTSSGAFGYGLESRVDMTGWYSMIHGNPLYNLYTHIKLGVVRVNDDKASTNTTKWLASQYSRRSISVRMRPRGIPWPVFSARS